MVLTVTGGRVGMSFGSRLKILCIERWDTTKATELEAHFAAEGVHVSHQAINTYFSGRSIPEELRLVGMMDAMDLDDEQRKELVNAYAEKRPGLRQICSYLS